jgi:hypothetical protein
MPACMSAAFAVPPPLVQIRHGYAADFGDLCLSVEVDGDGWKARASRRKDGRILYAAERCSLKAAQSAVTEFALWSGMEPNIARGMAPAFSWREYW